MYVSCFVSGQPREKAALSQSAWACARNRGLYLAAGRREQSSYDLKANLAELNNSPLFPFKGRCKSENYRHW